MTLDFNKPPIMYWDNKTIIEYLQRNIIIHSIMYYELNDSCITDRDFDKLSLQLIEFMKNTKNSILEKTAYYYVFKDFDGSTGYYIYDRLNKKDKEYLSLIANNVLKQYRSKGSKL